MIRRSTGPLVQAEMASVQRAKRMSSIKPRQTAEAAEAVPSDLLSLECAIPRTASKLQHGFTAIC